MCVFHCGWVKWSFAWHKILNLLQRWPELADFKWIMITIYLMSNTSRLHVVQRTGWAEAGPAPTTFCSLTYTIVAQSLFYVSCYLVSLCTFLTIWTAIMTSDYWLWILAVIIVIALLFIMVYHVSWGAFAAIPESGCYKLVDWIYLWLLEFTLVLLCFLMIN